MSLEDIIKSCPIFERVLSSTPASIVITAPDGSIEYVNPFFENLTGYAYREAIGLNPKILKYGLTPKETYEELWRTILSGETWQGRFVNKTKDGRLYFENARIAPLCNTDGEIEHFIAIKEDVTTLIESQRLADAQKRELDAILDLIPAWVFYKDLNNRFIRVNRAFAEASGMSRSEFEGASCFDLYPREQAEAFWRDDQQVITTGLPKPAIIEPVTLHDGLHWVQTEKMPLRDVDGKIIGVVGFAMDITHLKLLEEKVRELSFTDELTGLNNRRGFLEKATHSLQLAVRLRMPCALLFIDMNGLKAINDTFGHNAGDEAIHSAADILRNSARKTDIVGRIGGDEFAILMFNSPAADINHLIHRILTAIEAHNSCLDTKYKLSMSIGSASFDPANPITLENLMEQADKAMYKEKLAHRSKRDNRPGG